jgi:hypothetical protein
MHHSLQPKRYVVRKDDNLDRIARQHGYTSWKVIYHSEFNADLRRKSPNPNLIHPDMVVMIPPKTNEVVTALKASIARLRQARNSVIIATDEEAKNLKRDVQKVKSVGKTVDGAKDAIMILQSVAKIAVMGFKAMKLSGPALDEINKKATKEVLDMAYSPIKDKGLEVLSEADLGKNVVVVGGQIVLSSFLQMTSPSFWSSTISNLMGGMSWSEAVTTKPDDVYNKCVQELTRNRDEVVLKLDRKIRDYERMVDVFSRPVDKPLPIKSSLN